jgi:hypothetical protein
MTVTDELLAHNETYAAAFTKGDLPITDAEADRILEELAGDER